jgi:two-component system CheB/CheR fusion protein
VIIVAIGASAGGLDACRKLLNALPPQLGLAFVIVQHLDPTHDSLLVELLATHTSMKVLQVADGMLVERDHLYIIPPGAYLSVAGGALHLSLPAARHGARLPFDFLLQSLAEACGRRVMCIVLSGTGADGSHGLRAIKAAGGLVIAQEPEEAEYDGMPQSAILTGDVDKVLRIENMPAAITARAAQLALRQPPVAETAAAAEDPALPAIIELLRATTTHDFTLYKPGTLARRNGRRMVVANIAPRDMGHYLKRLRDDSHELDLLAKDLLINVTSFFRDPAVFEYLQAHLIPGLVRGHRTDQTLRIWVAGCSTGEETYSLAILFREEIAAAQLNIKLQIFATDVDADAVAAGREGLFDSGIEHHVSAARLARFFTKEELGYRVSPELRSAIVFTVQDVLADPPFSRIDMISCRNLLIYLLPEAQAKVIALFHFALRQGGYLLLGSAETLGNDSGRFEVESKEARLFRHVARSRPGELGFSMTGDGVRVSLRAGGSPAPSRQKALAELCRRIVLENYAPAAALINQKHECLFSMGPLDRYLRVAPGHPTHDLLAMARPALRTKLRAALQQAWQSDGRATMPGGRITHGGATVPFTIDVHPLLQDGEKLLLVCFIDENEQMAALVHAHPPLPAEGARAAELEHELQATRAELRAAIRNLELSGEEQTAINEEALSVNEEYQSTNEELLTSKEELQSLNEELTALNSQLQETLERQRTTANDLQNILYSTDVATLFLDTHLNIRFFTPATKSLFSVIPGDVGRPLADLKSLAADADLLEDAQLVIAGSSVLDREIEAKNGSWYLRRVLPYRTQDNGVEGVVITFADISDRRQAAKALEAAKADAEVATLAKSRFLAAASHDLRQPLQALALLQGLLARKVETPDAIRLVALLTPTLTAMTTMLDTLLDINQIDAGTVQAHVTDVRLDTLFVRLRDEFAVVAMAKSIELRVVPSSCLVHTDKRLLEQMLRNLLSNAIKYTNSGKILLGCRRRADCLRVEIWDTGIGIPAKELALIFNEYHQLDNAARERSRGLGLGLSIVKRLGHLLGHRVDVHSRAGVGSTFTIEVGLPPPNADAHFAALPAPVADAPMAARAAAILLVEDDPDLRELLGQVLREDGHNVTVAADGVLALGLVVRGKVRPDLVLADFNLPLGMDGLKLAAKVRERMHQPVPVIILTGDISTDTLRDIAAQNCVQLSKPVKRDDLASIIQANLPPLPAMPPPHLAAAGAPSHGNPVIFIVDDDKPIRDALRQVLQDAGHTVEDFASCEEFLAEYTAQGEACLIIDAYLPGMQGIELLRLLHDEGHSLPAIMITGDSDVAVAVLAMKAGAMDFIEKPVGAEELLASVARALELSVDSGKLSASRANAADHLAGLTARQRQIMDMVLAGHPSKNIAADLGISQRTVENHRAAIMHKTGSSSLPALARLAVAAAWDAEKVG